MYLGYNGDDVERYEASANRHFLQQSKLPKNGDWKTLEKWGVQKLEEDDLFYAVTLPEGWAITAGEEHRESSLLDQNGFVRAHIFVKIAPYQQFVNISVVPTRYQARKFSELCFKIYDNGTQSWVEQEFTPGQYAQATVEESFLWFFKRQKRIFGILFEGVFYYAPYEDAFQKRLNETNTVTVINADTLKKANKDAYCDISNAAYSVCSKRAHEYVQTMGGW